MSEPTQAKNTLYLSRHKGHAQRTSIGTLNTVGLTFSEDSSAESTPLIEDEEEDEAEDDPLILVEENSFGMEVETLRKQESFVIEDSLPQMVTLGDPSSQPYLRGQTKTFKRLGQQLKVRVGLDEYNQRLVRAIKDKYHEELETVDHVDLCDPHITLLDLREKEDYAKGHIHNAINVPASQLIGEGNCTVLESTRLASRILLQVHVDSLLRYSNSMDMSHVFIFYYYSKHRIPLYSFFETRRTRKLLRKAIRMIEKSLTSERSNFHVCVAQRGFSHLIGDHGEFISASTRHHDSIHRGEVNHHAEQFGIRDVIAGFLYYGEPSCFRKELSIIPDGINERQTYLNNSELPSWVRCQTVINASSTKYSFEEPFITCHNLGLKNVEKQFLDILEAKKEQFPFFIVESPLGCSLLVSYLVYIRKWSVSTSLLHVIRAIDPKPAQFDLPTICNLLLHEKQFLSYSPSIKLQSVISYLLGDEDLDISIAFYESGNDSLLKYREQASHLFKLIHSAKRSKVLKLLELHPDLAFSRSSVYSNLDSTPLLCMCAAAYNWKDKVTLKIFTKLSSCIELINLCDIEGMTALHIVAQAGLEHAIKALIASGSSIYTRSYSTGSLPLHYATESDHCSPSTLELLMDSTNIDTQDHLGFTALHAASRNGNKGAMNLLLSKGAQIKTNAIGQTPVHVATKDPKILRLLTEDARPGRVYGPFSSFSPLRANVRTTFLVDGKEIFASMVDAIKKAVHTIYITGWWITPDYYLLREGSQKEIGNSRLDKLLLDRANHGVNIFILIWENIDSIMPLKSSYSRKYLGNLHANIQVEHHASSMQSFLAWSHHQKTVVIDESIAFVGGLDICLHRWDTSEHSITDPSHVGALFPGRDYYNSKISSDNDDRNHEAFVEYGSVDRSIHPRMPWHDVTCCVEGEAATDVALNFVQRWNFLIPKRLLPIPERPVVQDIDLSQGQYAQVVRSIGRWSLNSVVETSIYQSYLHCIAEAESFIYIENQFFISPPDSKMKIADAILSRIKQALEEKKPFRVIILLPIHPEGDIAADVTLQRVYSWQQKTILNMDEQLKILTRGTLASPSDYISFHSLRNWDELNGCIVTEMIYVHTKLLITDKHIICGSANINERSMMGDRDSELSIVFRDPEKGNELRKKLWAEHLAVSLDELSDSVIDDYLLWDKISCKNTSTYINLFEESIAESEVLSVKQYTQANADIRTSDILKASEIEETLKKSIQGHLVRFPVRFLHNEIQNTLDLKHSAFQQIKEIGGLFMDDLFR